MTVHFSFLSCPPTAHQFQVLEPIIHWFVYNKRGDSEITGNTINLRNSSPKNYPGAITSVPSFLGLLFSLPSIFVRGHFSPDDHISCSPVTGNKLLFLPNERNSLPSQCHCRVSKSNALCLSTLTLVLPNLIPYSLFRFGGWLWCQWTPHW